MFKEEFDYFIANQSDLVSKYRGKFLVIKGQNVVGNYSTALEAYTAIQERQEVGLCMIQSCEPGADAYTVTIATANLVQF